MKYKLVYLNGYIFIIDILLNQMSNNGLKTILKYHYRIEFGDNIIKRHKKDNNVIGHLYTL
jgi:hypothetical protein